MENRKRKHISVLVDDNDIPLSLTVDYSTNNNNSSSSSSSSSVPPPQPLPSLSYHDDHIYDELLTQVQMAEESGQYDYLINKRKMHTNEEWRLKMQALYTHAYIESKHEEIKNKSRSSANNINIRVVSLSKRIHTFNIHPDTTIEEFKFIYSVEDGPPPHQFWFLHSREGRLCEQYETISKLIKQPGDVLYHLLPLYYSETYTSRF